MGLLHDCQVPGFQAVRGGPLLYQRIHRCAQAAQSKVEPHSQALAKIPDRRHLFFLQPTVKNLLW